MTIHCYKFNRYIDMEQDIQYGKILELFLNLLLQVN